MAGGEYAKRRERVQEKKPFDKTDKAQLHILMHSIYLLKHRDLQISAFHTLNMNRVIVIVHISIIRDRWKAENWISVSGDKNLLLNVLAQFQRRAQNSVTCSGIVLISPTQAAILQSRQEILQGAVGEKRFFTHPSPFFTILCGFSRVQRSPLLLSIPKSVKFHEFPDPFQVQFHSFPRVQNLGMENTPR